MSYPSPHNRRSYHRQPRLRPQSELGAEAQAPRRTARNQPGNPLPAAAQCLSPARFDKHALAKRGLRIGRTTVGKGLFATKRFVDGSCIGEIQGMVITDDNYVSRYAFDLDDGRQLEPSPPFRFVNHCCVPNCAFQTFSFPSATPAASSATSHSGLQPEAQVISRTLRKLLLFSICDIDIGQELTIDYSWPAIFAIPCACRSTQCRGWIVDPDDLPQLLAESPLEDFDGSPSRSA